MEKKQSSIDCLAQAIYDKMKMKGDGKVFQSILEEHRAMHKDEIEEAYWQGLQDEPHPIEGSQCDKYYNKTFGGNNE